MIDLLEVEILREIKKTIVEAAIVRVLRSGNIDIILLDKTIRDRTQALPSSKRITIYRREYLVEVPFILLSIYIIGIK